MPLSPYDPNSDWLQSLMANYGAQQPYGPGAAGTGLGGHMPAAGLVAGYGSGPTPGAPSMGYPAAGQATPQSPPAAAASPPWLQFGGFHPQNILQGHAGASLGQFNPNFPVNSAQLGGDTGGVDPTGYSVTMGGPSGALAAPAPASATTGRGGIGSDANAPVMGAGGFPTTYAAPGQQPAELTPSGTPSATPRPSATKRAYPLPPSRPRNLGVSPAAAAAPTNSKFGTVQYQVPGSGQGGPLSRSPIYTALNLFGAK
jgi:hypothetical protein